MASTTNNGFTISATPVGARYNGRKEQTAIKVAPSNPQTGPMAPSISALRRSTPRAMAICALSVTTMALSTNIPMAIIKPASDVRFSPTPSSDITSKVPPMEKINDDPISIPALNPITNMIITITISSDSTRFRINPLLASLAITFSGYNVTSSMPAGISDSISASFASTRSPVFTTSFIGSDDIPIPMAGLPSTRIKVEGGLRYPFSIRAKSPNRTDCPLAVGISWLLMSAIEVYVPSATTFSCC